MIRALMIGALVAVGLLAQAPPRGSKEEQAVVREISKIRMFPKEYAKYLRSLGTRFRGPLWYLHDHVPIRTNEGRDALEEAADFLEDVKPIPEPLVFSEGLHGAARSHVLAQGPTGLLGHVGVDKSTPGQRMERFGKPGGLRGEVINYGEETPRMTVIQLVIDDGVPDRGHRKNIFNPAFGWRGRPSDPTRNTAP